MPDQYAVAQAQRAALLRGDRAVSRTVLDAYYKAWQSISERLSVLTGQLQEARSAGLEPSAAWLYEQDRLLSLQRQVAAEVSVVASRLAPFLTGEQARWVEQARRDTAALVQAGTAPTGGSALPLLHPAAIENVIGFVSDGSPLHTLLQELGPDAAKRAGDALVQGVTLGHSPRDIARTVRSAFAGNMARALLISRDAVIRSYQESAHQTYLANADVLSGWRWLAAHSPRTCPSCLAMSGTLHPLTERLREHPGGRCFPAGTWVSGPPPVAATSRYYCGDLISIRTAAGHFLACTPEHPIQTRHGWLPAHLIHEGTDVISSALGEWAAAQIRPDEYQVPIRIEEIAGTFGGAAGVAPRGVPGTAVQLNGGVLDRQVDVVWANRRLWNGDAPSRLEPLLQQAFANATLGATLAGVAFDRLRPGNFGRQGQWPPSAREVRRLQTLAAFYGREGRGEQPIGLEWGSPRHAGRQETSADDCSHCPVCAGEAVLGLPGEVAIDDLLIGQSGARPHGGTRLPSGEDAVGFGVPQQAAGLEEIRETLAGDVVAPADILHALARNVVFDRVLDVGVTRFAGHVFNLQTTTGWYIANGVVVHNCTPIPEVRDNPAPFGPTGADWFDAQPDAVQREIVGPKKFEALSKGLINLEDLSIKRRSARWGSHRGEASYAEALKNAAARKAAAAGAPPVARPVVAPAPPSGPAVRAALARAAAPYEAAHQQARVRLDAATAAHGQVMASLQWIPSDVVDVVAYVEKLRPVLDAAQAEVRAARQAYEQATVGRRSAMLRAIAAPTAPAGEVRRAVPVRVIPARRQPWKAEERKTITDGAAFVNEVLDWGSSEGPIAEVTFAEVPNGKTRRSYNSNGDIFMADRSRQRIESVIHELGHSLEHASPGVQRDRMAFLARRTAGEPLLPMRRFGSGYGAHEYTRKDQFKDPYTGVDYRYTGPRSGAPPPPGGHPEHSEVISMGLQALYEDPEVFARDDPDFFDFMISVLRRRA